MKDRKKLVSDPSNEHSNKSFADKLEERLIDLLTARLNPLNDN